MANLSQYKVGQLIELSDGRQCVIRFLGQTSFAPGDWVGVEFEDASGKNDGSVQGERYFDCDVGHGMFLKPTGVAKVLEEPTPKRPKQVPSKTDVNESKPTSRQSTAAVNGTKSRPAADPNASKRAAMNSATPTPVAKRQSVLDRDNASKKVTSRTVGSTATSSAGSSRGVTPPNTTRKTPATSRPSVLSQATKNAASDASTSRSTALSSKTANSARPSQGPKTKGAAITSTTSNSRLANSSTTSRLSRSQTSRVIGKSNDAQPVEKENSRSSLASRDSIETKPETEDDDEEIQVNGEKENNVDEQNEESQEPQLDGSVEPNGEPADKKPQASGMTLQPAQKIVALNRKVEELETKIRLLEKKRSEDIEKLANLEKLQSEKERLEKIIQSLQTKLKPQSQELSGARTRIKELEEQIEKNEGILAEHESEMEMAMLDREMAEETAEALRMELDALKEKQEEMELELEVLREENSEIGHEAGAEEQNSRGWLQLQRQNERYREALVRLRDVSQATETELKEQVTAVENDLQKFEGIREQYETVSQQLAQSEGAIEDLKQQLEAALASEEMVEELTELNNGLSEDNRKLKVEIDELQTINELNNEFEFQREENEKQMQEEIDTRGAVLKEATSVVAKQDEKLAEYEYTISKFRDVVSSLQSHIEDLKATQQISEAEADELSLRSKAMTDLNMKLRSSAAKTQINTVDLEMRRLEAQEAAEHLNIVQMFLPDGFKQERDSILVYLRFKRVSFKVRLLYDLLKDRLSSASFRVFSEGAFVCCQIMDRLMWISAMCDRFVNDIKGCSLERFSSYERALPELDPVERTLNGYIDLWKKDEIKEHDIASELQRTMAVLNHLSEVHMEDGLATFAEEICMKTSLMQSNLETTSIALTLSKSMIEQLKHTPEQDDIEADDELDVKLQHIEGLISQARSAKVTANKILNAVEELRTRSMSMQPDSGETFAECTSLTETTANYAATMGTYLFKACDGTSDLDVPLETAIRTALDEFKASSFPNSPNSSEALAVFSNHLRQTTARLMSLHTFVSDLSHTLEFIRPAAPWTIRAESVAASSLNNVSAEAEVQRLKDVLHEKVTALRTREQEVEEQNVKIELLEARTRDANSRAKRIEELQGQTNDYKRREREITQELEKKFREAESLRTERDKWKADAEDRLVSGSYSYPAAADGKAPVETLNQIEMLKTEVKGLQGAVRYLRSDNIFGQQANAKRSESLVWLSEPLISGKEAKNQADRRDKMEKEGAELLRSLMYLTTTSRIIDLSALPSKKLGWRPAREKGSWKAARQSEEWAAWNRKREGFATKAVEFLGNMPD